MQLIAYVKYIKLQILQFLVLLIKISLADLYFKNR